MADESLDFVQRGRLAIARQKYADAVKICRLGLLGQPTLLEGRIILGHALSALERWDEVLIEMHVALESEPNSVPALVLRGRALVGMRDYLNAAIALERAKQLDPSNVAAAQLMTEIAAARAQGLSGAPAELSDTKVYPAKAGEPTETEEPRRQPEPPITPMASEYDDGATEEDTDRSDPKGSRARLSLADLIAPPEEREDVATRTFSRRGVVTGGASQTADDSAAGGRRFRPTPSELNIHPPAAKGMDDHLLPSLAEGNNDVEPQARLSGSIGLGSGDLIEAIGPQEMSGEIDDETTRTRKRQANSHSIEHSAPFVPSFASPPPPLLPPNDEPMMQAPTPPRAFKRSASLHVPDWQLEEPLPQSHPALSNPTQAPVSRPSFLHRLLWPDGAPRFGVALMITSLFAVVAVAVVVGLFAREWRLRGRVQRRDVRARQLLASGTYRGFERAESLYADTLAERDDPPARALRARILGQLAFEFGESPEPAERELLTLGENESEDAAEARVYVAMAKGEFDRAVRLAESTLAKFHDTACSYLLGRAQLLVESPDKAVEALRSATQHQTDDPMIFHGLGLAQAAAGHDAQAMAAYDQALKLNATNVATLIDQALLRLRTGRDVDRARASLESVLDKFVGDFAPSPAQRARAHIGIAEYELSHGQMMAARKALDKAMLERRKGDLLLSEELAQALRDSYQLTEAEEEARRAYVGGRGRLQPRILRADIALRKGLPKQALELMGNVNGPQSETVLISPEALLVSALANLQLGRKEQARLDADKLPKNAVASIVAIARVDLADGHIDRAKKNLEKLERESKSKIPEVALVLGQVSAAQHDLQRASNFYHEALRRNPTLLEARMALAKLAHDGGRIAEARDELKQIQAIYADYVPARRELGLLSLEQGDAQAAREQFDELVSLESDMSTLLGAARAHLALGEGPAAESYVIDAQKLAPPNLVSEEMTALRARAYLVEHRPAMAVPLLNKAIPTATRGELPALLIQAYLDLKQPELAAEVVTRTPVKARAGTELAIARARLLLERKHFAAAGGMAEEAANLLAKQHASRPLEAEAKLISARALWAEGSAKPALQAFKLATELDPRNGRAFFYLGLFAEEIMHDVGAAQSALERAVQIDPKLTDAIYHLARVQLANHDSHAMETFAEYLKQEPRGTYAADARREIKLGGATPTNSPPRKRHRGG